MLNPFLALPDRYIANWRIWNARLGTVTFEIWIPLIQKIFSQTHLPGSKFDAKSISGDARAIYCDLVNLEREVTVTFEIWIPLLKKFFPACTTSFWVEIWCWIHFWWCQSDILRIVEFGTRGYCNVRNMNSALHTFFSACNTSSWVEIWCWIHSWWCQSNKLRIGEFGTRGYCNVRNMNSVIAKVFFGVQYLFLSRNLMLNSFLVTPERYVAKWKIWVTGYAGLLVRSKYEYCCYPFMLNSEFSTILREISLKVA